MDNVGIIINSYKNNPDTLAKAIGSCLDQTGVNIKLVISTVTGDTSIAVATKISKSIKIVISEKPGIYQQLNFALPQIAKTDWFFYFSGNDICHRDKAQQEISACKSANKSVCYSDFNTVNELTGTRVQTRFYDYNFKRHLTGNFVNDCALVKTNILNKYSPFVLKWGNYAYYDFWLRIYKGEGNIFCYNPNATWDYYIRSSSKHVIRRKNPKEKAEYRKIKNLMLSTHRASHAFVQS